MSLRYPIVLLLLLLVPLLVWLRHRRAFRAAFRFGDGGALHGLPRGIAAHLQPLLPLLYGTGLILLIVALARPQAGLSENRVRADAVDIVLLLDISPSMAAEDLDPAGGAVSRLDAAKRVLQEFIEARSQDRLGLVAFAALPYSLAPLTLDHAWLLAQLERLQTGDLGDGTGIGTAMASAVNRLRDSTARSKLVVLLTDGVNNVGELTPVNAALAAKALGIRIYTVAAGTEGIVRIPVQDPFGGTRYVRQRSEIDTATLEQIAETTGGHFFRATDLSQLREVYRQIDQMEKTAVEIEEFRNYEEHFMPFALAALALLAMERLLAVLRLEPVP